MLGFVVLGAVAMAYGTLMLLSRRLLMYQVHSGLRAAKFEAKLRLPTRTLEGEVRRARLASAGAIIVGAMLVLYGFFG